MAFYLDTCCDFNDSRLISNLDELPLWSAPFGKILLDKIIFKSNANLLDIGCGTGFPLIEAAQRLGKSCKAWGIDPWNAALDRAREKIDFMELANIELVNTNAEDMPFEDEFFDLIISNNGLNNVEDAELVLKECFRTARKNAQMLLTMNLPESMKLFYDFFKETLIECGMSGLIADVDEHIFKKRKTAEYTRKQIESAGFEIINITFDSFNLKYIDGTAFFNHYLIKLAFLESWKKIIGNKECSRIFNILEEKLNIHAQSQNGLCLEIPFVCFDTRKNLILGREIE